MRVASRTVLAPNRRRPCDKKKEGTMAEKSSYIPGTASWVDLMTPDLERAKAFYGSVFGWTFDDGGPQMGHYNRVLVRGKQVAGMMGQSEEEKKAHPSAWNVYFDTTNMQKSLAAVAEAGGMTVLNTQDVMDLGKMAFCVDPSGGSFGLWQAGTHKGAQLFGEPGAMAWHELRSRDLTSALPFYEKVLGHPLEKMPMEGAMEYYTQKADQQMHAGFMAMPNAFPKEVPSHWAVYFAVQNADETATKIKAAGGIILSEPFDTPYGRNGFAKDPFGAPFAFIQANF